MTPIGSMTGYLWLEKAGKMGLNSLPNKLKN
jgi:hypothetical protein